jgi:hypothetical protein
MGDISWIGALDGLEQRTALCTMRHLIDLWVRARVQKTLPNAAVPQGDDFAARAFWWEARDLFLHLFVDGASVPLGRGAPLGMLEKLHAILVRLVRFLITCERPLINQVSKNKE